MGGSINEVQRRIGQAPCGETLMRATVLLPLLCMLAACSAPPPPDPEQRPEPKAATPSPITATANVYKDAAHTAADTAQTQAAEQAKQADAATQ